MEKNRTHTVALIIGYFIGFEKYGIDTFYNRKFQKWLVYNSTDAESLNSENDNFNPIFDEAGFITNVTFTPFENGVPLTETFYIDEQINQLNEMFDLPYLQKSEVRKIKHFLNYLKNKQEVQAVQIAEIKNDKHLTENWFKVGLLFATGEMETLLKKHNNNFTQTAKELGNQSGFRPFISETKSNTNKTNKNIYSEIKKLIIIREYCKVNNIEICNDFESEFDKVQSKNI